MVIAGVPALSDPQLPADLRSALVSAGYTRERVREAMGAEGDGLTPRPAQLPLVLRTLPQDGPLPALVKLFLLGVAVPSGEAARALAPLSLGRASEAGLVEADDDDVRGLVRLVPWEDLILACDAASESSPDLGADHVMGVTPSSMRLAHLTVRRPVGSALDLGTGSGIQALLAARHAQKVVATDLSPRALAFTSFNAALNAIPNVEVREGSLFEPVMGEAFDLVVSNPPFVISPDSGVLFRDSGLGGDAVSREAVLGAARSLRDGGLGIVLVNWAHEREGDWSSPLRAWVADAGCDAWLLRFSSYEPLEYASSWNLPLQQGDPSAYEEAVDRWMAHYAELGIDMIAYGAVLLRRRPGRTWVRADTAPSNRIGPAGEHVARLLAVQDFLNGLPSRRALLDEVLVVAEASHMEQRLRFRTGGPVIEAASLRLEDGLRFEAGLDAATAHVLARLDGRRRLGVVLQETAVVVAPKGVSADEFIEAALLPVERMLALGFLIRVPR